MKVFALGDLHLSLNSDKPMDIFGENWSGHFQRVQSAWDALVSAEDIVLLPGDLSWAMRLEDAMEDIMAVAMLKGRKVLLRGNHDYWWSSITKLRTKLPQDMYALQNDALLLDGVAFAGTRGWICPGSSGFDTSDAKIYERELVRLELSLSALPAGVPHIAMLHYPPCNERRQPSGFIELLERHEIPMVVYGHLHGSSCRNAFEGIHNGVSYTLCSADHLDFAPKLIFET